MITPMKVIFENNCFREGSRKTDKLGNKTNQLTKNISVLQPKQSINATQLRERRDTQNHTKYNNTTGKKYLSPIHECTEKETNGRHKMNAQNQRSFYFTEKDFA